ncbi:hypothetical protein GBAR_LOCUS7292 [Geodia barretti]|uniref:Uncharacterized protein n=1 Tax=Geodia barretti TaxID=519541 RepID=A0AA35WE70_GEOBA|nr:hypothetical protein GBAR_LOCUS7292 [Geodia barretti]
MKLRRPLFLEGEAGVRQTERQGARRGARHAADPAAVLRGLDVNQAVYEWNYSRQLLEIRMLEASDRFNEGEAEQELFSEKFPDKATTAAGHRIER